MRFGLTAAQRSAILWLKEDILYMTICYRSTALVKNQVFEDRDGKHVISKPEGCLGLQLVFESVESLKKFFGNGMDAYEEVNVHMEMLTPEENND